MNHYAKENEMIEELKNSLKMMVHAQNSITAHEKELSDFTAEELDKMATDALLEGFTTPRDDPKRIKRLKGIRRLEILANGGWVSPTFKCLDCSNAWSLTAWMNIDKFELLTFFEVIPILPDCACPECSAIGTIKLHWPDPDDPNIINLMRKIGQELNNGIINRDLVRSELCHLALAGNSTAICVLEHILTDAERWGENKTYKEKYFPSAWSKHLGTRTKQWVDWETGIGTKRMWE